jgi:AraC family transcriptional regulator of arabinose operon
MQGKGTLSVNGKETDLHFGQMFMTKPGEETWYKADADDPWVYCWMAFDGSIAQKCVEEAGFVKGVNVLDCHVDTRHFYSIVSKVLDQAELTPSNVYSRTGHLLEFISTAVHSNYESERRIRKTHHYPADDYVTYAADFIRGNYATVKIGDVAKIVGLNRSYLTNLFKAKMGVSPQEYLMQCKLNQACKLLEETENPIQEISRQIGYDNPLTFSKTFKSFYGVSPREYRRSHRSNPNEPFEANSN